MNGHGFLRLEQYGKLDQRIPPLSLGLMQISWTGVTCYNLIIFATYFSGILRAGKRPRKSFTTSEQCAILPTKQYLPLAEAFSKARI